MSLNYTTLQSTVLAQAARAELTAECPQFIRMCEAMIRRKVRAFETRTTLDDSDRGDDVTTGLYTLPDTIQEVRAIYAARDGGESYALENVGLAGIRMLPSSADPQHYAVSGSSIEIRGIPGDDAELEVVGIGWPDPLETTATNTLLSNHEDLYVYGTLFHLYQFTQDLELAQAALSTFTDAVDTVNEQIGRRIGGGSVLPAYNFGHVRTGRGY
jgi:hypothetical protein